MLISHSLRRRRDRMRAARRGRWRRHGERIVVGRWSICGWRGRGRGRRDACGGGSRRNGLWLGSLVLERRLGLIGFLPWIGCGGCGLFGMLALPPW